MNRVFVIIAIAVITAAGLISYSLYIVMPHQAWAVLRAENEWEIVQTGWNVIWRSWPILLLGLSAGVTLSLLALPELLSKISYSSARYEIKSINNKLEKESARRKNAVAEANEALESDWGQLYKEQERSRKAAKTIKLQQHEVEQMRNELFAREKTADEKILWADESVKNAEYRAKNAICAAQRIKKKHLT